MNLLLYLSAMKSQRNRASWFGITKMMNDKQSKVKIIPEREGEILAVLIKGDRQLTM